MPKSTAFNVTQNIAAASGSIAPADTTTKKTLYTASANDAVLKSLTITSTDTAAQNVQIFVNDGTADRLLGTINVPANSGNNGTVASVDGLTGNMLPGLSFDQNGKRILPMKVGHILKVSSLVTVTAAKQLDFFGTVEEY